MQENTVLVFIKKLIENIPTDWLKLTTHRLDIYNEKRAKVEFLEHFDALYKNHDSKLGALKELPTAYDYIRLGHPLSCVLEWTIAQLNKVDAQNVISFSSTTIATLAILRENLLSNKATQILYFGNLPDTFDAELLRQVYGYQFELKKIESASDITAFDGSTILISEKDNICDFDLNGPVDFFINYKTSLGSIVLINTASTLSSQNQNEAYAPRIQHVRRRETIAMTPADCLIALKKLVGDSSINDKKNNVTENKALVSNTIKDITGTNTDALVASSGLSIQYAITMGLIHHAQEKYPGKAIKIVVPPNCYGGTNDQARRVAAFIDNVDVVDLLVDSGNDMVKSIDGILENIAQQDAVPYIIAEIPTNPRVEVPDLQKLKEVLSKERQTANGAVAVDPVFILDQTFCPNTRFLGEDDILSTVKAIAYISGSKFPSGGRCTAGFCVANKKAQALIEKIGLHLTLCDNEATDLQYEILAQQMPSMTRRIREAYENTREFVNFIHDTLPKAKINFVSEELANQGFTPSVFSLDLPTKGDTAEERENHKRALNLKLINAMIGEIPHESKYCVSYGQLKGCYWTIPATSTQGTTKEDDKDYIVRVAVSPNMDLELHKKVFLGFVRGIG